MFTIIMITKLKIYRSGLQYIPDKKQLWAIITQLLDHQFVKIC